MSYTVWTTGACNLRCKYCYEGLDKPHLHMTMNMAKEVINFIEKDFKEDRELLVNFHGGEPFLNFAVIRCIVEQLEKKFKERYKLSFSATTNGTILDGEMVDFIREHDMELTFSIDGRKGTHDRIRIFPGGKGSHRLVMKNAKKIIAQNPMVRIRMTVNPDTVDDLCDDVEYLLEEGFEFIVPGINSYDNNWTEAQFESLKREIKKIKVLHNRYPKSAIAIIEPLVFCGRYCNGGINNKHIYYDGSIFPCLVSCGHEEFKIGDVMSGINMKKHKEILSYSNFENKVCHECDIKDFCSASRCKIINKLKTGDYLLPSLADCNYTNLIYELNGIEFK